MIEKVNPCHPDKVADRIAADARPTDNNGTIPASEQPVIESVRIVG